MGCRGGVATTELRVFATVPRCLLVDDYRALLHCIAENPGLTADQIESRIDAGGDIQALLDRATADGDVICVNDRYWIIRKDEFAVDKYDHPETEIPDDSTADS